MLLKHLRCSSDSYRYAQSDITIEYPVPDKPNRYVPLLPQPPTGDFDTDGLKRRVDYAEKIRKIRDISDRTLAFMSRYKDQCLKAMRLQKKSREDLLTNVRIDEGILWSRWEEMHGKDGVLAAFLKSTDAMVEMRLAIEYGDILAGSCKQLKGPEMNNLNLSWKRFPEMDWMAVTNAIDNDNKMIEAYRASCAGGETPKEFPKVPWWTTCQAAATKIGTTSEQIQWEIAQYAKRNSLCHQGISEMIAKCCWDDLGKQLLSDKTKLKKLLEGKLEERAKIENCIQRIIDLYFEDLFYDNDGKLMWSETRYAKDKKRALLNRLKSKSKEGSRASSLTRDTTESGTGTGTTTPVEEDIKGMTALTMAIAVKVEGDESKDSTD